MNAKKTTGGRVRLATSSNRPRKEIRGNQFSLTAYGSDVRSTVPGGYFRQMTGTSMSAPYVSGAAALLMEASPDKTAKEIMHALLDSAHLPKGKSTHTALGAFVSQLTGSTVVQQLGKLLRYEYDKEGTALSASTSRYREPFGKGMLDVEQAHTALTSPKLTHPKKDQVEFSAPLPTKTNEESVATTHTKIGYMASVIIGTKAVQSIGRTLGFRYTSK